MLSRFAAGALDVVSAPQILDEGVEVPAADTAVILAASRSRRQMIQRMGWIFRRKPDGRSAHFVVVFVEGTIEDPALGANEGFSKRSASLPLSGRFASERRADRSLAAVAGRAVHWTYAIYGRPIMSSVESRRRSRRLELRTTPSERDLIERAVAVTETDLTDFVVTNAVDAARRVLAERDHFALSPEALAQWEQINARRTRDLPGLRRLMERPSPFAE